MTTVANYIKIPRFRVTVTHGGDSANYDNTLFQNINIRRIENGIDQLILHFSDYQSKYYDDYINEGDTVTVKVKDIYDTTDWASITALFNGRVYLARPTLTTAGEITVAQADGSAYGLMQMLCADEYGSQSNNPTLDTIKEIVEDTSEGLLPEYVNDILNSGVSSGFSYTSQIETIAGTIPFMEFPYKPCHKVLDDLCDIVTALKAGNAGPHWIVDTSNRLLLATVGNHGAPASTYWPTWLNSTTTNTLEQGKDFLEFNFEDLDKEANYVLFHGHWMRPVHDLWTEGNASEWTALYANSIISDEATNKVVGANSLELYNNGIVALSGMYYPSTQDLGLDLTKFGGEKYPADLCFYARADYGTNLNNVYVRLWTSAGNYFEHDIVSAIKLGSTGKFVHFRLPVGNYWPADRYPGFTGWTQTGTPSWANINAIEIEQSGIAMSANYLWLDDLHFEGSVLRAARQSDAYSATDPCKMIVVTDNIGKDDTGKSGTPGTTDQGTIALMAKAEYYRLSTTPIVGSVTCRLIKDALPGQLVHVHAKKQVSGSFTIDTNMRILKAIHNISLDKRQGCTTVLEFTSDVINGRARTRFGDVNKVLQSARPEFQDRQASSIKMPDLDLSQPILTESY